MPISFERIRRTLKSFKRFHLLFPIIRVMESIYLILKLQWISHANLRMLNRTWGHNKLNLIPIQEIHDISIPQTQGIYCYNPTILAKDGKVLGFARTTNVSYLPTLDYSGRSILRQHVPYLLNGIVSFELDKAFRLIKVSDLRTLERVPNLEDPKAVLIEGDLNLFCNFVSKEQNGDDRAIHCSNASLMVETGELTIYKSPFKKNIEKNWIPFLSGGTKVSFFYSVAPQILLVLDPGVAEPRVRILDKVSNENFHGGSQLVEIVPNLFVRVARRRIVLPRRKIATLSYLVFHNSDGQIIRMSKPFLFKKFGFEICNGLTLEGENLLFSWGEDDIRMYVGRIPIQDLLAWAQD